MTTWNKAITKEEAVKLFKSTNAKYPNTEHNKNMMKCAVDEFLLTLRDAK